MWIRKIILMRPLQFRVQDQPMFFTFMNAMIQAARDMGFNESESELLVAQTFKGAVDLYNKSDLSCEEWIRRVASKGGTTEAAMAGL